MSTACGFPVKITLTSSESKNQRLNFCAAAWRPDWLPRFGITNLDRLPRFGITNLDRLPRFVITNLDRFSRFGINMGSVATFRHNLWIKYHIPVGDV
uniref:Uncharacterized protein n=1 Tax=Solanum tuberosum TaxID=4113 RepID=M1DDQ9_SOLTU